MRSSKALLSSAVSVALVVGSLSYAYAQEVPSERGCKGYARLELENVRLINPLGAGAVGTTVTVFGAGIAGGDVIGCVTNPPNAEVCAPTGSWNTPPLGDPNAPQSCVNGDELVDTAPCPPQDTFEQQAFFVDFGRADSIDVPGTFFPGGLTDGDPAINGDDFSLVCEAQRTFPVEGPFVSARGGSNNVVVPQLFTIFAEDPPTRFIELRADLTSQVEARVTEGGTAQANHDADLSIQRLSDAARVDCTDASFSTREAEVVVGPGVDLGVPPGEAVDTVVVECDAWGFNPPGFCEGDPLNPLCFFQPAAGDCIADPTQVGCYEGNATVDCDANCLLLDDGDEDKYKWYFMKQRPLDTPRLPIPIAEDVELNDQFVSNTMDVFALIGLWNPAGKNEEVDPTRDDHYDCYSLNGLPVVPDPRVVQIETENFGLDTVTIRAAAKALCVPSIKTFPRDGTPEGSTAGPAYRCYAASSTDFDPLGVTLDDQFFENKPHGLAKLSHLCAPVGINEPEPPTDPEEFDHLACYDFPDERVFFEVLVEDQFTPGPVEATVEFEQAMCEPARKILLP